MLMMCADESLIGKIKLPNKLVDRPSKLDQVADDAEQPCAVLEKSAPSAEKLLIGKMKLPNKQI